jgi:uncharacterized protein (DUF4415 family)
MSDTATTAAPEAGSTPAAPAAPATQASEPTFTKEQVDAIVTERVNKKYKEYESVKAQASEVDTLKEQNTGFQARIKELENDFGAASRDAQVLKVALDKGLPGNLLSRLQGNTVEELAADADVLIKQFGAGKQPFTGFDGGTRPGAQIMAPESPDALIRKASGF